MGLLYAQNKLQLVDNAIGKAGNFVNTPILDETDRKMLVDITPMVYIAELADLHINRVNSRLGAT